MAQSSAVSHATYSTMIDPFQLTGPESCIELFNLQNAWLWNSSKRQKFRQMVNQMVCCIVNSTQCFRAGMSKTNGTLR